MTSCAQWWPKALESCTCDPSLPRTGRCTKSGWARCEDVFAIAKKRMRDQRLRKSHREVDDANKRIREIRGW